MAVIVGSAPIGAAVPVPYPAPTPVPASGTIAIRPTTASGEYDPSLRVFADVAAAAFAARGFTVLDDTGHAAYLLEVLLGREEVGTGKASAPGDRAVTMAGAGVAVPLSTGKSQLVPIQRFRLELRIRKRGAPGIVWDGVAVTVREAGTRSGGNDVVATDLIQALLRSYPTRPRGVIAVP